ncbi:MAG TPA: hypothetical protein VE978_09405 [Chitinophagales bacterium]|nr:hypothetical protein [Chitinophagales bacterium]
MKTLVLQPDKPSQLDMLLHLAKELGINARVYDEADLDEKRINLLLAETSFAKDWNSNADDHWDEFLKNN